MQAIPLQANDTEPNSVLRWSCSGVTLFHTKFISEVWEWFTISLIACSTFFFEDLHQTFLNLFIL